MPASRHGWDTGIIWIKDLLDLVALD